MHSVSRRVRFLILLGLAVIFTSATSLVVATRLHHLGLQSWDLAFYTQALHNLSGGSWQVSLLGLPWLGNHSDVILLAFLPLYILWPSPLLPVLVQNLFIAAALFPAYKLARMKAFPPRAALAMAIALLLCPAAWYAATHEFHPESLAIFLIPTLLLAWEKRHLKWYAILFTALLLTKINLALLLVFFCAIMACSQCSSNHRIRFFILPGLAAIAWLFLYLFWIQPVLNPGNVAFTSLYEQWGDSPREWLAAPFREPAAVSQYLWNTAGGSLFLGLFLSFGFLSLFSPRWLLIASPLWLQHLLSNRSSEWEIYFHYGAPLLALSWIGAMEGIRFLQNLRVADLGQSAKVRGTFLVSWVLLGGGAAQAIWGPWGLRGTGPEPGFQDAALELRVSILQELVDDPKLRVIAPVPYLAKLANRPGLHSLHHLIKGLHTLSRVPYTPPEEVDGVLVDYADLVTFSAAAGRYHGPIQSVRGDVIESSDLLLHQYLSRFEWESWSVNELTLYRRANQPSGVASSDNRLPPLPQPISINPANHLQGFGIQTVSATQWVVGTEWTFPEPRQTIPWMRLLWINENEESVLAMDRGLVLPEAPGNAPDLVWQDRWNLLLDAYDLPPGRYRLELWFTNESLRRCRFNAPVAPEVWQLNAVILGEIEFRGANPDQ